MAKSLKDAGTEEARALKRRVLRQRALGRISETDSKYIVDRLEEIEARIILMWEDDPSRREF